MLNNGSLADEEMPAEYAVSPKSGPLGQVGLRIVLAVLIVAGLGLVVAGFTLANRGAADPKAESTSPAWAKVGQPAPDFQLNDVVTGKPVRLSALKGKPVWINFWATWCDACRTEMPAMKEAYARYKDTGLVILGIDMLESPEEVTAYAKQGGYDWPLLIDTGGLLETYQVNAIPTHWFVGRDGVLKATALGAMPQGQLEANVAKITAP